LINIIESAKKLFLLSYRALPKAKYIFLDILSPIYFPFGDFEIAFCNFGWGKILKMILNNFFK